MKILRMQDLLKKSQSALQEDLQKLQAELTEIKVKTISRKNGDDTHTGTKIRKQIARIHTALNHPQVQTSKIAEPKDEAKPVKAAKEVKKKAK
jgi:ribosomal protein L29